MQQSLDRLRYLQLQLGRFHSSSFAANEIADDMQVFRGAHGVLAVGKLVRCTDF
jgi:hypothetical protein